jgi:asparagine synthase (glutamine-hydrolysing)
LRDWAEDLLSPGNMTPALNATRVRRLWQDYLSGRNDNATGMWNVLMAQAWARRWL